MKPKNKIHLVGYAHLDPVWLWRWQVGFAEIKATFRSALDRMNEFPDFIFTYPCASYYQWVEENAPDMFDEIVTRVKEGRWNITGGMWVQPDCNIPSGESFARHFLLSQRYFKEKFGITAITGYNVDSFGHNASMPKLLQAAGIKRYVMMRPDNSENPDIPDLAFRWESGDGSRVLAYKIPNGYASYIHHQGAFLSEYEDEKAVSSINIADSAEIPTMYFYGVGNHGGGPTIKSLRTLERLRAGEDGERFVYSTPDRYFDEISGVTDSLSLPVISGLPVWKTDMQHHASLCYSACSEIKRNNRRAENRLTSAESFSVLSGVLTSYQIPEKRMEKAWQNVLFNQFHDIAAGCSIKEAYDDARDSHGEALNIAAEVQNAAVQKLSWAVDTSNGGRDNCDKVSDWQFWGSSELGTPIIVFNSLAWERSILTRIGRPVSKITDENGISIPFQASRASRTDNATGKHDIIFNAVVPGLGWRLYWAYFYPVTVDLKENSVNESTKIENEFLALELDPDKGSLKSLFDKVNKKEVFSANAAVALLINVEASDTWGHGVFEFRDVVGEFGNAKITLLESGAVRSVVRAESYYNTSVLQQDFILETGSKQLEVKVKLDWHEKFKLLKLSFPVNTNGETKAVYDIPYGNIIRKTNGLEETGQMWLDVGDENYGVALLNDSKYAFDVLDNDMRMTVANGSVFADHYGQNLRDNQNEFLDQGIQYFSYVLLPHAGSWRNAGVVKAAIELNTERTYIAETYHKGLLPQVYKGINVSADNIIITAIKPATDGNGVIIRAYESAGINTPCEINLFCLNAVIATTFPPYSLKTFRIYDGLVTDCDLTERCTT